MMNNMKLLLVALFVATIQATSLRAWGSGNASVNGSTDMGIGLFKFQFEDSRVCVTIRYQGYDASNVFVAMHIHSAPVGVDGPVAVAFAITQPTNPRSFREIYCTEEDPDLLAKIQEYPEEYYINVHTSANPSGAIRGQLV